MQMKTSAVPDFVLTGNEQLRHWQRTVVRYVSKGE